MAELVDAQDLKSCEQKCSCRFDPGPGHKPLRKEGLYYLYSFIMYVYLLESISSGWRYIGQTQNIEVRLERHNAGKEKSTKRYAPFKLLAYLEVSDRKEAYQLEQKLKRIKLRDKQYQYFKLYGLIVDDSVNRNVRGGSEK